jgi:hypothetical protein
LIGTSTCPLCWTYEYDFNICLHLLKKGANIQHKNYCVSLWTWIINWSYSKSKCLFKKTPQISDLFKFVENLDEPNKNGDTILHLLCECGCEKCITSYNNLLNEYKCDPNIKNKDGLSPNDIYKKIDKIEKQEEKDDEKFCCICFEEVKNVVFLPCKHLCSCYECAQPINDCPICRQKIVEKMQIYC